MTALNSSQLAIITVASAPAAAAINVSQLYTIAVVANGQRYQSLGYPIKLGCWTPCGTLMWNPNGGII